MDRLDRVEAIMNGGGKLRDVVAQLGVSKALAQSLMQQVRLRKGESGPEVTTGWLHQRYIDEGASVEAIAQELSIGVAYTKLLLKARGLRRDAGHMTRKGTRQVWNKGLTKETDERLAALSESRMGDGNPMAGAKPWNAGLTAEISENLRSLSEKLTGREVGEGTRLKQSMAKLGLRREQTNRWKGGHSINGYVAMGAESSYQHREVAAQVLGRPLTSDEHVHHMDGNKTNNVPFNLLVLSPSAHTKLHNAMRANSQINQIEWLKSNGIAFILLSEREV